jgi:dolichyl-phosphate beta-glucosyltransferase
MNNNTKCYLSVIIPCYNERENLQHGVLKEVYEYLQTVPFRWELIISDDGSTDGSIELIKDFTRGRPNVVFLENLHGGKPVAIFHGITKAVGEFILFTDMDQSTPLSELEKLLPFFDEYDVVIGSRLDRKNFQFYRRLGSFIFKHGRKLVILRNINDTQCGFKALKTSLAQELFPKLEFIRTRAAAKGWTVTCFDIELLYLAYMSHKRIKEVVVAWEDRDQSSTKKKSYIKESIQILKQVAKIKLNNFRGLYH